MIDLRELSERTYARAIERGKITSHHSWEKSMKDLAGEVIELALCTDLRDIGFEIADIILVCCSICVDRCIDVEDVIRQKVEYNEKRKD